MSYCMRCDNDCPFNALTDTTLFSISTAWEGKKVRPILFMWNSCTLIVPGSFTRVASPAPGIIRPSLTVDCFSCIEKALCRKF